MPLEGLERLTSRPRGGVVKVALTPASDFAGATGAAGGTEANGDTGAAGAEYVFREDGALYTETLSGDPLQPLVRHTLVMEFPAGEASRRAVDELVRGTAGGFVARIVLASGERLTAGYSARFGTAYPLRVTGVASVSGSTPADLPSIELTLESEDADRSCDGES